MFEGISRVRVKKDWGNRRVKWANIVPERRRKKDRREREGRKDVATASPACTTTHSDLETSATTMAKQRGKRGIRSQSHKNQTKTWHIDIYIQAKNEEGRKERKGSISTTRVRYYEGKGGGKRADACAQALALKEGGEDTVK